MEKKTTRRPAAEYADGQIGGQKNKRETQCPPSGMHLIAVGQGNGKGKLHQVIACGNDGDMKENQPEQRLSLLQNAESAYIRIHSISCLNRRSRANCSNSVLSWP